MRSSERAPEVATHRRYGPTRRGVGAALAVVTAVAMLSSCGESDVERLSVGDCVEFDSVDFTFGGDISTVSCDELRLGSPVYRVLDVGTESEMDQRCGGFNLVIVDGDDAACLGR